MRRLDLYQDGALSGAVAIDRASPPGAWRGELDRHGTCAVCRQRVCGHSDLEYQGLVAREGRS